MLEEEQLPSVVARELVLGSAQALSVAVLPELLLYRPEQAAYHLGQEYLAAEHLDCLPHS
jgi:hypothetical protein